MKQWTRVRQKVLRDKQSKRSTMHEKSAQIGGSGEDT